MSTAADILRCWRRQLRHIRLFSCRPSEHIRASILGPACCHLHSTLQLLLGLVHVALALHVAVLGKKHYHMHTLWSSAGWPQLLPIRLTPFFRVGFSGRGGVRLLLTMLRFVAKGTWAHTIFQGWGGGGSCASGCTWAVLLIISVSSPVESFLCKESAESADLPEHLIVPTAAARCLLHKA
jgi:hypothetical protein